MKLAVVTIALASTLALARSAEAKGTICEHVQEDMFSIDGLADDWSFGSTNYGTARDSLLRLHCAYDSSRLYLLVDVEDERLIRTKKAQASSEDKIDLELRVGRGKPIKLTLLPGSLRAPRKALGVPSFVELEDSLQDKGFSVELSIPLAKISGWASTVPYLSGKILFHDFDLPSDRRAQSVVGLKGKMHFSDAANTYKAFMKATGLKNRDVKLDRLADVDPGAGPERIIIGGKVMGVLGTSFNYMNLPIAKPGDLKSCRIVDFDGSGRKAVLTELRQFGNGGSRDVLIAWFAKGDGSFEPALTVETRKEVGQNRIVNSWSLVPRALHREGEGKRGKKRRAEKGNDLLLQVAEVVGFSASNYREAKAPDAKSILTPWGEQQSAVYYLDGTSAYGGQPALDLPKPRRSKR